MKVTEKMKKWYAIVAIALIAVLFSACGSHSESGSSKAAATVDSAGEKFNIYQTRSFFNYGSNQHTAIISTGTTCLPNYKANALVHAIS